MLRFRSLLLGAVGALALSLPSCVSADEAKSWSLAATPLDRDAAQLSADTAEHLDAARDILAAVLAVPGPRTIENTLRPLDQMWMHIDGAANACQLLEAVHPDEAVRDAAAQGTQDVAALATELSLDRALYEAVAAVDLSGADESTRYAVQKDLLDFRLAGVDRDEATRTRIKELNAEILAVGQDFSKVIAEDVREVPFAPEQLAGLPQDWIDGHPVNERGKVTVDTTYPDYIPFMTYAESPQARSAIYKEYMNRGYPANLENLAKLIRLREEKARLLGYDDWADYITADKMMGSGANAEQFIAKIAEAAREPAARDYALLLEVKRGDAPDAKDVKDWEKSYYGNKLKQERFDFNPQEMRPYFEYERVRQGIFDLTSDLFGVRYEAVSGLDLWHEDVTAWDMFDGQTQIGRFYLDMHPRENKYNHAACFPYRNGVAGQALPQAALVCNFPNPREAQDGVALMEFAQVSTFLHEFGHLIHHLFAGHQEWMSNSGISTEWDFVEAPSQLLEEWLYDAETLQSFARHIETDAPIPVELIDKVKAASDFGKGMNTAHQAFYAALSLNCYNRPAEGLDTTELVTELQSRYSPFEHVPGTHFQCAFGHLEGYSAIYYTYKWSEVIAKDLFSRFEAEGVRNPDVARAYRELVLEPGSSKPAAELVKDFLGRDYGFESFREWLEENGSEPQG